MSRIRAVCIVCLLLTCCMNTGCKGKNADNTNTENATYSSQFEQEEVVIDVLNPVYTNKDIELVVWIVKNDGISGINMEVTYDNKMMEFKDLKPLGAYAESILIGECTEIPKSNIIRSSYLFKENINGTGAFLSLRLHAKEFKGEKHSAAVNFKICEAIGKDGTSLFGNEVCVYVKNIC